MSWLGDSAAVAVLSFDVDAESPILAQGRRYADHAMVMTHQAYGPLVGVPRLLRLLADFERALAVLERVGVRPTGHRSALWEASWDTASLVAEYGLEYDSTLMDDDKPYRLETPKGTIIELPPHWSLDDWEQYAFLPRPPIGVNIESPAKVLDLWRNELDAMARHGCLFMLTNHPFLSGRPGRVETLRKLIEHALGRGDVAFATAGQVAARAREDSNVPTRPLRPVEVDAAIYPDL